MICIISWNFSPEQRRNRASVQWPPGFQPNCCRQTYLQVAVFSNRRRARRLTALNLSTIDRCTRENSLQQVANAHLLERQRLQRKQNLSLGEAAKPFHDFAFCFLPRFPLFPADCCIAFFLLLSCSCRSMPSASRYLCIGATEPSGWAGPEVFFAVG